MRRTTQRVRSTTACAALALSLSLSLVTVRPATAQDVDDTKYDGKTIAEWVAELGSDFRARQAAIRAFAEIGAPAVPPLVELIESRAATMGQAMQALAKMGPDARPALPVFLELISDRERESPEGWTWNVTPRWLAISEVREMSWASAELVPVLLSIAISEDEEDSARSRATHSLGGMKAAGEPALRKLTRCESAEVREHAHLTLAANAPQGQREYFAELLEQEPCTTSADTFVSRSKGIVNAGKLDPLTERVKAAIRACLSEKPDAELAMTLARIISDQLASTSLCWAAPTDSSRSLWARENPKESFHTLREALEIAFAVAAADSELRRELGESLARLHLLLGDWKGMNEALASIGEKPVPEEGREWLTAPPSDWKDLASAWTACDESLRSGTSTLVMELVKDGKPLQGVHVLVKEAPPPQNDRVFRSGISADTLFLSPSPMGRLGGFGYRTPDRPKTRYAVSSATGIVRFEKLPAIPVKLEVLVPTSNFAEPGAEWELLMEVAPSEFKVASNQPGPNTLSSQEPPGRVVLEEGATLRYPKLIVRPRTGLNLLDFASVDPGAFTLMWQAPSADDTADTLRYEVELAVSAPAESPDYLPSTPTITTAKVETSETSWPLGEKGVGGIALVPGNFYWVEVTAYDANDTVAFRSPKTRFCVPWKHRASAAPQSGGHAGTRDAVPITHGKWWRGSSSYGDGTSENLRQKVDRFLGTKKDAFEYEYVALGSAWLDWRDGDPQKARAELARLIEPLPDGNVAKATAKWLIGQIDSGAQCPKRLQFTDK